MASETIQPQHAKADIDRGEALLVCAHEDREKFAENHLQGAMPLNELQSQENRLPEDQELIFYCD